ncbi:PadR family transcriptional regulator [Candidatus Fermentibacterales bacterium]|nr:PadR family transcriptional regulator [Candidatus Fermentibacterales bacterium]
MPRRRGATRYAILGMLNESPMSGYDVKKRIETDLGHFWRESYGKIYPELRKLVLDGLATVRTQDQEGRPSRKVYTITVNGMVDLRKWASQAPPDLLDTGELLLKIYHGHLVSSANTASLLRKALQRAREELQEIRQHYEDEEEASSGADAGRQHRIVTLRYRLRYYECLCLWAEESLEKLEGGSSRHL